ncbi:juvenile hormone epoxide hydrolase 1-like isoform X3 [Athalia rosae]|uniref:juvenile hormone epoxide hydrolase 1-like isoform X2 n=1 Tax=Athalia rosae TaxID=37344 RepID=UPI002033E29C|nr:juvenile hormone epoxide hydrolase 1-like isoform X2 [Athalia rosae]XP_048506948.1 juvenile hormone epoxide hydrolase 1-like isoform X3 [Athalia rosae]
MWIKLLFGLLLAYGVAKYFCCNCGQEVKAPVVPNDQWWGPGQPRKVDESIRPFKIDVPKEVIDDLKSRLEKTRTLVKPLEGAAWTYGIGTDYLQTVLDYWRTKYDWNKRQSLLNRYPQFKTNIQGLDIHFYHVKPTIPKDRSVRVLPMLVVHGWPGSIVEFQKIIPLLTTPRPDRDFVFELIIPCLPGYGFSDAAVRPGLGHTQMTVILKNLMDRVGFKKFYTHGSDWGSVITAVLGVLYPSSVEGLHLICLDASPWTQVLVWLGSYFPSLIVEEKYASRMYPLSHHWSRILEESGYLHIQSTKPDTVGVGLTDSPAGLAAYILEKFSTWTNPEYRFSQDGKLLEKFTLDELLDNVMVYWITNSITTSARLYAESSSTAHRALNSEQVPIHTPVACAAFPNELMYTPEWLLKNRFRNLIQMNHFSRGGHFAAFEEPQLLADDVWTFVGVVEGNKKAAKVAESSEL